MTFPIPNQADGDLIDDAIWNALVGGVNQNHDDFNEAASALGLPWSGGTALSRIQTLESTNTSQGTSITNLNNAVGMPYSGATALEDRANVLEADKGTKGRWYQAVSQSIARNAITKVTFDATDFQSNASIAANRTDITLNRTGLWLLYYGIRFNGTYSDWIRVVTWLGLAADSATRYGFGMFGAGMDGVQDPGASFVVPVNVTGASMTLSAYVYQNNNGAAARDTMITYQSTELYAKYLG